MAAPLVDPAEALNGDSPDPNAAVESLTQVTNILERHDPNAIGTGLPPAPATGAPGGPPPGPDAASVPFAGTPPVSSATSNRRENP
jgi:hypothetical protein